MGCKEQVGRERRSPATVGENNVLRGLSFVVTPRFLEGALRHWCDSSERTEGGWWLPAAPRSRPWVSP